MTLRTAICLMQHGVIDKLTSSYLIKVFITPNFYDKAKPVR